MPALLSPKVVVVEKDPDLRAIRGVPTATTAIIGIFERGQIGKAKLFTNIAEARREHGGFITAGRGPEAIDGFFRNGGKNLYIVRTVHYTDITDPLTQEGVKATVTLKDTLAVDTLQVDAKSEGAWGNKLTIAIKPPTSADADEFNLEVILSGVVQEVWPNLSMTDADANFVETLINDAKIGSNLIRVIDLDSASGSPADLPTQTGSPFAMAAGDDGLVGILDTDFIGDAGGGTGLEALAQIPDVRLLMIPDRQTVAVHQGMQDYAEVTRDGSMVAVFEPPVGSNATAAKTYMITTASLFNRSEYSFMAWPWIKVPNPSEAVYGKVETITVPPAGHICGMFARVDGSEPGGVYKAAAGIERGIIRGMVGVDSDDTLDVTKRDLVYPVRINPITKLSGTPFFLHGSVTTKDNGKFPFINQRRGVIFIELSIQNGLIFVMHGRNNNRLRATVDRTVFVFLLTQFRHGAFAGDTAEDSFTLDVDIPGEGINNAAEQQAGKVNVEIGLAMVAPAQFVVIRISPDQRAILELIAA